MEDMPLCFVCSQPMADDHNFLDEKGQPFLHCPTCEKNAELKRVLEEEERERIANRPGGFPEYDE